LLCSGGLATVGGLACAQTIEHRIFRYEQQNAHETQQNRLRRYNENI
jgi:hypothetical protein